ncbi:hypothetical protein ATK78_3977 [Pedobacter metabolipauper]|uniref:Uncharacterized protein n=1 Tax=Pedobacter metabolipauper TaxID=425513 RepID=A0A4R6SQD7_9SPHI|nr:hypothetical protein ATK78_3977 [Pedobacter metabolipauper]
MNRAGLMDLDILCYQRWNSIFKTFILISAIFKNKKAFLQITGYNDVKK